MATVSEVNVNVGDIILVPDDYGTSNYEVYEVVKRNPTMWSVRRLWTKYDIESRSTKFVRDNERRRFVPPCSIVYTGSLTPHELVEEVRKFYTAMIEERKVVLDRYQENIRKLAGC